jgi:hypothetical protein
MGKPNLETPSPTNEQQTPIHSERSPASGLLARPIDNKAKRQLLGDLLASADPPLRTSAIIRVQNDVIALGHTRSPEETIRLFVPKLVHSLFREYERQFGMDVVMLETTLPKIAQSVPRLMQWPFEVEGDIAIAVTDTLDACSGEWQARIEEEAERTEREGENRSTGSSSPLTDEVPVHPHTPSRPKAATRGRALLDKYRRQFQSRSKNTFQSLYNNDTVTHIAIYQYLRIDRSRYYKFLGDKLSRGTWESKTLTAFFSHTDLPAPTWCNGERIPRKKT